MNKRVKKLWARYQRFLPLAILAVGAGVAALLLFAPLSDKPAKAVTNLKDCPATKQFDCYASYFTNLTETQDAKPALAELKRVYDAGDGYAVSQCHQLAHQIGHAGFNKYQGLADAYQKGDTFCWSGYYHGVTEEAVGQMGKEKIKKDANIICNGFADQKRYSFEHYNCVHGLGHGFMTVDNFNLFNALKTCDLLTDSWERSSCYGGVFMENVMVVVREDGKSDYLKPDQPMYPCTAVDDAYKYQCYLMQTSYALQQNGYDFKKGFLLCRDVADSAYTATCYQSLGRDASGSTVSDIAKTKAYCEQALDALGLENCVMGAVRDFVSYHHSDVQAKQLCAAFSPDLQQRCVSEVASYYSTFR